MPFNRDEVADLLAKCRRHCCICYRFCGIKIETDHMVPEGEGGSNKIENAIPLCFECHAEVHLCNNEHPRGRKYTPAELRQHKEQWLDLCENKPSVLLQGQNRVDSGVLSAVISELEFNLLCADLRISFETREFHNAISNGILSLLEDEIKNKVMNIYAVMKDVNESIRSYNQMELEKRPQFSLNTEKTQLIGYIKTVKKSIEKTIDLLQSALKE